MLKGRIGLIIQQSQKAALFSASQQVNKYCFIINNEIESK